MTCLAANALAALGPLQAGVVGVGLRRAGDVVCRRAACGTAVRRLEVRADYGPGRVLGHRGTPSRPAMAGRLAGTIDSHNVLSAEVDLREGGERLDGVAQHFERDARTDGERGLLEPFA